MSQNSAAGSPAAGGSSAPGDDEFLKVLPGRRRRRRGRRHPLTPFVPLGLPLPSPPSGEAGCLSPLPWGQSKGASARRLDARGGASLPGDQAAIKPNVYRYGAIGNCSPDWSAARAPLSSQFVFWDH
eukprot:5244217-Pyramimonas_sp.AAC.1